MGFRRFRWLGFGLGNNRGKLKLKMIPKKNKSKPSYPTIHLAGKPVNLGDRMGIAWNAPKLLQWFLKEKCNGATDISVTLIAKKPKRTDEQNSFFHVYLDLISISSGHTMDELKAWYKGKFLSKGIAEVFGDKTRIVKSSADLNISEFAELMNQIEEVTSIPIPDPSPFNIALTRDEYGKLKAKQNETYLKMKAKID